EEELASARLIDRAGMLALAVGAVAENPRFVGIPTLFLDVPVGSTRERDLIAALAQKAPQVLATVPMGDERTAKQLAEGLATSITDISSQQASTSLAALQRYLFGGEPPERVLDDTVTVTSAPGEMHECVEIARKISAEAAAGTRFDRMAVLLRDPVRYVPHLQEALARAGIPAHFSREAPRPRPGGRALLAPLACQAAHLSARPFPQHS